MGGFVFEYRRVHINIKLYVVFPHQKDQNFPTIGFIYRNSRLELESYSFPRKLPLNSIHGKIDCFIVEITTSVEFYWLNPKT
jgi:hypothetical protein